MEIKKRRKTSSTRNSSKKPAVKKPATKTTKSVSKTQTQELAEYIRQKQTPEPEFQYIANEDHYDKVIEKIKDCKKTLWIGTADIKDLYVKDGRGTKPLLEVLSDLAKTEGMERVLCPRVHFKIIVFDLKTAYVGSANLTGAGLGMKGENTRNFEAGVLSSNKDFVNNAAEQFDSVWMGAHCKGCSRKKFCGDPIV